MPGLWVDPDDLDQTDPEAALDAAKTASYILWTLSGRKFSGPKIVTERYSTINTRTLVRPELVQGRVINAASDKARLRLRGLPVQEVKSVRDCTGTEINRDEYMLAEHSTLIFPSSYLPETVEVTYMYGSVPPVAGRRAARILAEQLILGWRGDDDCALPERVTSISREGISMSVLDSQDFLQDLRTGIYMVDLFLKSANSSKARMPARVFSPDLPRGERITPPNPPEYPETSRDMHTTTQGALFEIRLSEINAEFAAPGSGWEPELVLRSAGKTRTSTVTAMQLQFDDDDDRLFGQIPYAQVRGALGNVNRRGTWDLYVTKDGEMAYLASGNLSLLH